MLKIQTSFRTDAAGRTNNEDNGCVIDLGKNGCLLCVCDGMGGMAAGEIASAIATDTIKKCFESITETILQQPKNYLEQCIIAADNAIKQYGTLHPETNGMGSTIVLVWIMASEIHVAWCGDSRAYRYNTSLGLEQLTHDHSLVQTWVDNGMITEEEAFNHPQSNVITRSLGNPDSSALPESNTFSLYNDDCIILCTDGLWGTIRDIDIEQVLMSNFATPQFIEKALWTRSQANGWHDNVTTAIANVKCGGIPQIHIQRISNSKFKGYISYIVIAISVAILVLIFWLIYSSKQVPQKAKTAIEANSLQEEKISVELLSDSCIQQDTAFVAEKVIKEVEHE